MATDTLIIGKKEFEVEICELNQADLNFYPENPRIYSALNLTSGEPTQQAIEEYMCNLDHVKQLKVSIASNGGLIDPLIVSKQRFVLEGNSRLAAYRLLCAIDPIKWGRVRCKVLKEDVGEATIFTLLGQYHIIGRKDWDPYEQAHYLYRRHEQTNTPVDAMAQELGLSIQKAEKMIQVIKFMIDHNDLNKYHWSHYEEYLKNASIKKFRTTNNTRIDDTISEAIKNGEIREAQDMRKLGEIARINDKQSKKIMQKIIDGNFDIYDGYEELSATGKLDDVVKKLKKFRAVVNEDTFEKQLTATPKTLQEAKFEIKQIVKRLTAVCNKLK